MPLQGDYFYVKHLIVFKLFIICIYTVDIGSRLLLNTNFIVYIKITSSTIIGKDALRVRGEKNNNYLFTAFT